MSLGTPVEIPLTDRLAIAIAMEFLLKELECTSSEMFAAGDNSQTFILSGNSHLRYRIHCNDTPYFGNSAKVYEIVPQDMPDLSDDKVQQLRSGLQKLVQ